MKLAFKGKQLAFYAVSFQFPKVTQMFQLNNFIRN